MTADVIYCLLISFSILQNKKSHLYPVRETGRTYLCAAPAGTICSYSFVWKTFSERKVFHCGTVFLLFRGTKKFTDSQTHACKNQTMYCILCRKALRRALRYGGHPSHAPLHSAFFCLRKKTTHGIPDGLPSVTAQPSAAL